MNCNPIFLFELTIPCGSPLFLTVLAVHVPFGIACTATGVAAMLSEKGPGRHPRFGTFYYWGLAVVCLTAAVLSAMRWAENRHLFILALLSFAAASVSRTAHRRRWRGWIRLHLAGMSLSYILMLTAFYVDNGKSLPLWQELPPIAYWILPGAVGLPLIAWAWWRHPLVRRPDRPARGTHR